MIATQVWVLIRIRGRFYENLKIDGQKTAEQQGKA